MSTLTRLVFAAGIGGLLLTGCAEHPATRSTPPPGSATSPADHTATPRPRHEAAAREAESDNQPTDRIGVAACDDYLSSYLACHRAAAIYPPDQLQSRYEAMRAGLLRDSKNPDIRPQLAARCNSLASQLREALHGKSCTPAPAAAASSKP